MEDGIDWDWFTRATTWGREKNIASAGVIALKRTEGGRA